MAFCMFCDCCCGEADGCIAVGDMPASCCATARLAGTSVEIVLAACCCCASSGKSSTKGSWLRSGGLGPPLAARAGVMKSRSSTVVSSEFPRANVAVLTRAPRPVPMASRSSKPEATQRGPGRTRIFLARGQFDTSVEKDEAGVDDGLL